MTWHLHLTAPDTIISCGSYLECQSHLHEIFGAHEQETDHTGKIRVYRIGGRNEKAAATIIPPVHMMQMGAIR